MGGRIDDTGASRVSADETRRRGDGAQLVPLSEVRRIELDADVLTGNSRSLRDDLSGRDGFADLPELL